MTALALRPARRPALATRREPRSISRRSRARLAALSGLVIVLAAHGWLAVQAETNKPHWRDPEFFHRVEAAKSAARTDRRPLLAILGGSRPQMGLNPEAFGDETLAFNFSQSGCLPVGEWLNFTRLLEAGLEPRFVLIEVLPPVLADAGPMEDRIPAARLSSAEVARLAPFHDRPEQTRLQWANARASSWWSLRVPLLANAGLAEEFPASTQQSHRNWAAMSPRGWSPAPVRVASPEERDRRSAIAKQTYSWLLNDFAIRPVNDRAYRAILAACRERGIPVALFLMPESPAFRSWYPEQARRSLQEYLQTLGATVFDCSDWIDDESAFRDGHHLERAAAERFSERFGRECVTPWVKRMP